MDDMSDIICTIRVNERDNGDNVTMKVIFENTKIFYY